MTEYGFVHSKRILLSPSEVTKKKEARKKLLEEVFQRRHERYIRWRKEMQVQANNNTATIAMPMDKTKQKTIMDMSPQELIKSITASMGGLIRAEIRTAEVTIKANTEAAIKALEERLIKRLEAVEQKLDENLANHEGRIERLEDHTGIHKN